MNYTDNYNLNLPEGTDIVNPLVDTNPNFVTIDTQMKANEDATVGTATEIKTGTVHAITRSNGNNNTFRFTATSVYNAGDSFTVDAVPVTALLPSGEALDNNAFVIGSNVLCVLTSTELTIYTVGGTASNSKALNGQPASYYLNSGNINYDNTASGLSASKVKDAIDEVNTKIDNDHAAFIVTRNTVIHTNASGFGAIPDYTGYTPIAVVAYNRWCNKFHFDTSASRFYVKITESNDTPYEGDNYCTIVYIRNLY